MSLRGAVSDEIAGGSSGIGRVLGSAFAAGEQGAERGTGGGVLDDTSAGASGKKFFGEAKHGYEPIEDMGFEFGGGGAGGPEHALDAESRGEQIAEDGRPGGVAREVGEKVGRLPVRDAGEDEVLDVAEDRVEGLALLRPSRRQLGAELAGLRLGEDGEGFDFAVVVGDPVDDGVAVTAELAGGHVEGFFVSHRCGPLLERVVEQGYR